MKKFQLLCILDFYGLGLLCIFKLLKDFANFLKVIIEVFRADILIDVSMKVLCSGSSVVEPSPRILKI
jgi:hypothetical protein